MNQEQMRVRERVALVTGAGRGLGAAVATQLGREGYRVVCVDRNPGVARAVAESIVEAGGLGFGVEADVTLPEDRNRLFDEVREQADGVDVLVNNAGILDRAQMKDLEADGFRSSLETNLVAPFELIKMYAPQLRAAEEGRIINVASVAALNGYRFPAYAASKAALKNLTSSLLMDFWGSSVTINAVCPGAMDTGMLDAERRDQIVSKVPTGRIVSPDEAAGLIAYLASPGARSISGAAIPVDGGATQIFRYF